MKDVIVGAEIKVNVPLEVAVPPPVVTVIVPVVPLATTAVILVALTTTNDVAAVPPKLTAVAPVKFVPVIVTAVPTAPLAGERFVIVGADINVNELVEVAVPPGVVTKIVPVDPLATTAVILVALTTTNDVAAVPPKLTAVAPVKFVPVIVTVAPAPAVVGVKDVIAGACINVNVPLEVAVPPGVVTEIVPVVPVATTTVILVALTTTNDVAAVPPKLTAVAPVKFVPVIVTVAPAPAVVGVKDVIVGCAKRLETNIIVKLRVTSNFLKMIISFIIYTLALTNSL